MLLHACLSALNTAFLICLLGWGFFFLVLPTKIPLLLPSPHSQSPVFGFQSLPVDLVRLHETSLFHSCWSTKFHSASPHPCPNISPKGLSPPSSIRVRLPCLSNSLAWLLAVHHEHEIPESRLCSSSSWLENVYAASVWLPSCLSQLHQAIPHSVKTARLLEHSVSHPRPVSSHAIQTLNCIHDNSYPSTSPTSVNQWQLWVLTGTMLSGIPGKAFSSSNCSPGRVLCIARWRASTAGEGVTQHRGLHRYFLTAQQHQDSGTQFCGESILTVFRCFFPWFSST